MQKLIIRADGNSKTGLGHLYRVFALIEMYKQDYDCVLVTRSGTTTEIIPEDYIYFLIPDEVNLQQEPLWLIEKFPGEGNWLLADGYHFDSKYQKAIKNAGFRLLYIDDLTGEHMYADVVVNHSLSVKASDYKAEPYTRFALGTSYAILRPLFLEAAKQKREIHKLSTAFVCFGGADPLNLTFKATKALLNIEQIKEISIVLGAAYPHNEIYELGLASSQIQIHKNLSEAELLAVMQKSDFAIAPSSNILYELFAVKMPVLSGFYVDNQKSLYKGCVENGLIFEAGNFEFYTTADFEKKIKALLTQTNIQTWINVQAKVFYAGIKRRFLNLLRTIAYRKASEEDVMQVFEWSNDPLSRTNSYFSDPIPLETHKKWFAERLKDLSSSIYIAEVNNVPAGMIRYSLEKNNSVVGILIGEKFRGQGFATDFLVGTAKLHFKENKLPIFAYIKVQNKASVRSFEKAGYQKLRDELVHGVPSYVYKLTYEHV